MAKIASIEGIGPTYGAKLGEVGIDTTEQLLDRGATPKGRQDIEETTSISGKLILEWINRSDLFRIRGVQEEYSDLLEASGVDTVPELAQRNAENLYERLVAVNAEKRLVRRLPSRNQVADWVEQAKGMERVITY